MCLPLDRLPAPTSQYFDGLMRMLRPLPSAAEIVSGRFRRLLTRCKRPFLRQPVLSQRGAIDRADHEKHPGERRRGRQMLSGQTKEVGVNARCSTERGSSAGRGNISTVTAASSQSRCSAYNDYYPRRLTSATRAKSAATNITGAASSFIGESWVSILSWLFILNTYFPTARSLVTRCYTNIAVK